MVCNFLIKIIEKSSKINKSEINVVSVDIDGNDFYITIILKAAKNLKSMKKGDRCFFYHSNIGKEIVGIVEVISKSIISIKQTDLVEPDVWSIEQQKKAGRFYVAVTVKFLKKLKNQSH